jgi:hypothetical protein
MAENEITSFTPSELLHSLAVGILKEDMGKSDDYSAADYLEAHDRARLVYSSTYREANPSAAAVERRQMERRLEIKRAEEQL